MKSENWKWHENDKDTGLFQALCKQLHLNLMSDENLSDEICTLCHVLNLVHTSLVASSQNFFENLGSSLLTSLSQVINRHDPHSSPESLLQDVSSILLNCSRGPPPTREKMVNFDGLLSNLLGLLNGSWKLDDVRINAMGTISNMIMNSSSMQKIAAFPNMLSSVMEVLNLESGKLKLFAVVFIVNLSNSPSCVNLILDNEKLMKPIGMLFGTDSIEMHKLSLRVFENILKKPDQEIMLEKYALEYILIMIKGTSPGINETNKEIILRASKLLLKLAKTASVVVFVSKNGAMEIISNLAIYSSGHEEIQKNAISILRCSTLAMKSSSDTNFHELIFSLMKLLSSNVCKDDVLWLLFLQAAKSSETQLALSSMDGFVDFIIKALVENETGEQYRVLAAGILLNLSSTRECHHFFIQDENKLSTIIKAAAKDKDKSPDPEVRVLLIRAMINLALNKSNKKILANSSEFLPFLATATTPRKEAYVGARDAIYVLLED